MRTRICTGFLASLTLALNLLAVPREAQWKAVDEALKQGLPTTAIEHLETIIADARAHRAYPEAIKAICRKVALEGTIAGNKPEEKIVRLQAELDRAPAAMKPVMEAVLARWYWQYFQQNRWRIAQRTQTAGPPGADLQTWDLARLLAEIDRHFSAALADAATLQATPIAEYEDLLEPGTAPDSYRPTLFDFLAYDALEFYQAGEQGSVAAEEEFEVDATGPIFDDAKAFLAWRPKSADSTSPALKAIGLYQALLRFHRSDFDPSAYRDADLARLAYGSNVAVGDAKDDRYQAALRRFIDETARHEISARALAALASRLAGEGEPAQARELARRGLDAFPKSAGGAECFNLIQEIETRSAEIKTEQVWNAPWPTINVTYRNVTKIYFRAVRADFEQHIADQDDEEEVEKKLLAARPELAWDADLPATTDFRERTERLPAPGSLKPGYYFILASHDPAFGETNNRVSAAPVWVSDLALILRTQRTGLKPDGLVLNAITGEPVAGAHVRLWASSRRGRVEAMAPADTDRNGRFELPAGRNGIVVLAEQGGQAIGNQRPAYTYQGGTPDSWGVQTVFFTDRAIYRPGQTIAYKGVSIRFDRKNAIYAAADKVHVTVVFHDANNQEIARAEHTTNDYGSFSGTFTAPRDRLTGRMSIQVDKGQGSAWFRVEEYKRPKFQVELQAPAEAAKLDAPVVMTGRATAYTGVAIGGAKVRWRVERSVGVPAWCWWWRPPATKSIAHGSAETDADGTFQVRFPATPDPKAPAKNEPVFVYRVYADVTDTTGETRSDERQVMAGYTALQASLTADEWQSPGQPVKIEIETASLDGDPQPASGTVTVYALKQPAAVARPPLQNERQWWNLNLEEPPADPGNPDSWEVGDVVAQPGFTTDAAGAAQVAIPLQAGIYRAVLETKDRFGRKVTARHLVQVVEPDADRYGVKLANQVVAPKWSVEPGEDFTALWGTGYASGRAFIELECNGKMLKSYWTAPGRTQELIRQPIAEELRGGITLRVTQVRENRAYVEQRGVAVPWSNQKLAVKWESFRSKLTPGQQETWTAVVTGPDSKRAAAEMVAALYDASLDQYQPHEWPQAFNVFRMESSWTSSEFMNSEFKFREIWDWDSPATRAADWRYRSFPREILAEVRGFGYAKMYAPRGVAGVALSEDVVKLSPFEVDAAPTGYYAANTLAGTRLETGLRDVASAVSVVTKQKLENGGGSPGRPDLSKVTARKNLQETAFFFPQLIAGDDGVVRMTFTMPEALTQWKFVGFAHDRKLRAGLLTGTAVTAKDLMVEPNPPRFVREGDTIEFTVKVSNQTDRPQAGTVRLAFADAATLRPVDTALGNRTPEQEFEVPAKQSRSYAWRIAVPDGTDVLTYKAVAATTSASDGEEGFLPVLSRRVLVTESLPLPIRGKTTKEFELTKLVQAGSSNTLRHESLTVQMVSQPAWYAVMALPYLMEFPYECSEQIFNRYYANALARKIATSDPKIRRIFDLWKNTPALDSPLEKNQDLKSVLLEETPWVREAKDEGQARRNVGLLFDGNRLDDEAARTLAKLSEQQLDGGLWSWFPGGPPNEYISLYIVSGFGRLRHLGVDVDVKPALAALDALDAWTDERYRSILKSGHPETYVPSHLDTEYLYARSFFREDHPVGAEHQAAVDFLLKQGRSHWLETDCRQCQALLALALQRFGDTVTPPAIMKSLKERSVRDDELGRYWRDLEESWWWYRAPIESQAFMIEAFAEVAHDAEAVEDCKVWLLKQKQTQDWRTTKATADAIYALLLQGDNLLASDARVEVALGGVAVQPEKVEAGTGFYEQKFRREEIKPSMGRVTVTKRDEGVSWGSLHWQYLEDMARVTPHAGTPLQLKKALFVKETTGKGPVLKPVTGPVAVGDELVVRLELRADRDLEFVHLKDQRGSGTEPVAVLSQYKYQDGLVYYESTRDAATHFFIDYLPKGTYVFEYSTRVQLKGRYQTGIAEIQCMYAPEFNSHSEGFELEAR